MAGKVLLINHGNALMANTLKRLLGELQIDIAQAEPSPEKIKPETKGAKVLIFLAGDYVYGKPELPVCLKELCSGGKRLLCVMGSEQELAEIRKTIPAELITREFRKPFNMKNVAGEVGNLVNGAGQKEPAKHILMVDDDALFLQAMQSWLGGRYQVTATKSGMQAITYLAAHKPDLILLDYDMPVTSGVQVLEMIRSEPNSADIPVIFLTGRNDRDSVMRVVHLRPEGYLLKSQPREEIIASIDRFFETKTWENP